MYNILLIAKIITDKYDKFLLPYKRKFPVKINGIAWSRLRFSEHGT
jgi:hypothetical protein